MPTLQESAAQVRAMEREAKAAQIADDLDRDMKAAGIDPDDDTPVGPTFAMSQEAWAKVYMSTKAWKPPPNWQGWEQVDARMPDVPIVTVTPEMVAAGRNAFKHPDHDGGATFEDVYRAMHAAAPVELVSKADDRVAMLERELASEQAATDWQRQMRKSDESCMRDALAWADKKNAEIAALEAENTRLHDELKARTDERDAALLWQPRAECWIEANRYLHAQLAARDARIEQVFVAYKELQAENTRLHDELKARTDERDQAFSDMRNRLAEHDKIMELVASLDEQIAARDARIRELDDLLAQRPAPVPDTPKLAHDWTRVEGGDRRMIGR